MLEPMTCRSSWKSKKFMTPHLFVTKLSITVSIGSLSSALAGYPKYCDEDILKCLILIFCAWVCLG